MHTAPLPVNPHGSPLKGIRGHILTFKANPALHDDAEGCYDYHADGLIVIQDGYIVDAGNYSAIAPAYPQMRDIDMYADAVVMPGFVDCHTHYAQSPMIGSYGETLLDWLERYAYPTESRMADKQSADETAREFFRQTLSQGTTTANVFATTYATSVNAFFEESERYNTRMICGKVLQDRNLPEALKDPSAEESIAVAGELLDKWHRRGRQLYAVIPRFAPTSSPRQLQLAGELYQRHIDTGVYLHTHLNESQNEIEWVRELFPGMADYTDVYRHFGLVDRMTVMAHCCIMGENEWQTLHDCGCGVAHCPSSNLFLGDGEFDYREAVKRSRPVRTGIGSDTGGGTSFSIPRQLGEAYKVAMLHGCGLSALKSFYMATRGGAEALRLENTIGSIAPGFEADMAVVDLRPSEFVGWRMKYAATVFEKLAVIASLGPDNLIRATYVAGRKVYDRDRGQKWMYADHAGIERVS
ncbi:guanine deaminase [Paramuribaculum intestinale]|uniref:guanine deaminase n=1 Tax=Paramuribaculum intestinale TaxID=2094151 RepID=UPI001A2E08EE|nr:guanine deaminase [Muribaculaceae bacterium]